MLNFIIGSSGTGKTNELLERIQRDIAENRRCFLLVPEQQAYISERDLPQNLPKNAGLLFEIVNFSGLAEDIFREYGGIAQKTVGNGAGEVLMWDTLRQLIPILKQYGKAAAVDASLTVEMLSAVEELRNNGIEADQLEMAADQLPEESPLRKKLIDLATVYATYSDSARKRLGLSAPERLREAAALLRKHPFLKDCNVYIDSFTSFTVPEYDFIGALLEQVASVTVSLCTDELHTKLMHFESVCETADRLKRLADRAGVPIKVKKLTHGPSAKPFQLQILERDLWNFQLTKHNLTRPDPSEPAAIHRIVCPNLYEESEACALNILGLIQGGMRYGDIAVVVRETDTYKGVLDAALERYGIPYFFSERTELSSKPLSRLILSAIRAVVYHYRTQDILTLVKTGLCGVDYRDAALFEEYCETWRINGNRFLDEAWSMNPDGLTEQRSQRGDEILQAANCVRKTVMEPLARLNARFRASDKLTDRCSAVYDYLCELSVAQQLSERAKTELALGQLREAGETVRLYRFATDALTDLCNLLPDASLSASEFLSVVSMYFSLTDLGSVPNAHDCVMIGAADTLRVEGVKASFLLGLCEGEFPKAVSDRGLLTESDKQTLEQLNIKFDHGQKLRSSEELLYVYRAMTKPTEQLFLSYPAKQPDGSERTPSLAFTRINFLFDDPVEQFDLSLLKTNNTENAEKTRLSRHAKSLPQGTVLRLSQSSIQAFVSCPYRFYATYCLSLRSKKSSDIQAADEGNFLHFVFERFLKSCLTENGQLQLPAPDDVTFIADSIVDHYISMVCPIPAELLDTRMLHLFGRLRTLALLILRDIIGEISAGDFRPTYFEQRLGGRGENALPLVRFELRDGNAVELRGTVDRVDLFEKDGLLYVRIVDYKTGEHKFSFDKVRSGDDLQLVLYLFAVVSSDPQRLVPCGAQFLYSKNEKDTVKIARSGFLLGGDEFSRAADGNPQSTYTKGLERLSPEELEAHTAQMRETVCSVAERILSGDAEKTPSVDACKFCPVIDHCDVACHKKQ
ncbi:MAG: hypothetical protein E7620_06550 [Ruminococcaceae bacterium]|nr:hypothetical protein [Oscillospiraceae bacterium]